jgi:hypothetical protein
MPKPNDPPGYAEQMRLEETLPKMSPRARAAFVAGTVERILPVLAAHFDKPDAGVDALELVWRSALGDAVPEGEIADARAALETMTDALHDSDDVGAPLRAALALDGALASLQDPDAQLAADAATEAQYAAHLDDAEQGDAFVQEEADWQMRALELARIAARPKRDMFAALPADARWRQELRRQAE